VPREPLDQTVVLHVTPGETLDGRWRLESRIGQGAMGSVFKGRDLEAGRPVAIKILSPEHCRKPKLVARFEREAETMTSLQHPHLVQLYGHGRRGALPYIVMEFLDGLTLAEVLVQRAGPLSVSEVMAVLRQLAEGLGFLHRHGLVHRDVKPQNAVVDGQGRVIILDLGVVRDQAHPGLTRPGAMVGTPYYMSPEQIAGVEDVDARTDVYALAAVAFELLTGRPPYLGSNNFEVLYGHKNLPTPDAAALVTSVPRKVAQVLMRGLAKDREQRPEGVVALVAELEAVAGARPVDLALAFAAPPAPTGQTRVVSRLHLPPSAAPPRVRGGPAETREGKTVVMRVEETVVGLAPLPPAPELPGQLQVMATAHGRAVQAGVVIDGQGYMSPCTVRLKAGKHQVKVVLPGHKPVERTAEVAAGHLSLMRVALEAE